MEDRVALRERQFENLKQQAVLHPELFQRQTFTDTSDVLKSIGIEIPHAIDLPIGFIKLWPQDFIVEEIGIDGKVYTVTRENLLNDTDTTINPEDQTIYATLVKSGISTLEAVDDICKQIGCDRTQIGYAGIKDKDAITAQRISFRNISFEKLQAITSDHFFLKDVMSGKGVISKGALKSNRFTLCIRTLPEFRSTEQFSAFTSNLKYIKENGFYNFFYIQRFGVPRISSYLWGLSILRGDYRKAVFDFLNYTNSRELGLVQKIRQEIAPLFGEWQKIINILEPYPVIFELELMLVRHLAQNPEDFAGALNTMPDQVMMWIYGISSLLFNRALSKFSNTSKIPPKELPLFLSFDREDWQPYAQDLTEFGIMPPPFKNLRPFPNIKLLHRTTPTLDNVVFHNANLTDQGIELQFSLNKGSYATTLLAHLFAVSVEFPQPGIPTEQTVPTLYKEGDITETIKFFSSVIHSKTENFFLTSEGQE